MLTASRANKKTATRIKGPRSSAELAHHQLSRLRPGYHQANRCTLTACVSFQSSLVGSGLLLLLSEETFSRVSNCFGVKASRR